MPYINPNDPNNVLSEDEIELLAGQEKPPISVQQYKDNNNLKFVETPDSPLSYSRSSSNIEDQFEQRKAFIDKQMETGELFPEVTTQPDSGPRLVLDEEIERSITSDEFDLNKALSDLDRSEHLGIQNLEKVQAEYDKVEEKYGSRLMNKKWDDYNLSIFRHVEGYEERELARNKLKEAIFEIKRGEIDVNVPETFAYGTKDPKAIAKAFDNQDIGYGTIGNFSATEDGNLEATLYNNQIITIPLNIEGNPKKQKMFDENIAKLKAYYLETITPDKIASVQDNILNIVTPGQVTDPVQEWEEGEMDLTTLNSIYKDVGYEVVPIYETKEVAGMYGKDKTEEVLVGYKLKHNGVEVSDPVLGKGISLFQAKQDIKTGRFEENIIQDYLKKNLTKDEVEILKTGLIKGFNEWVQIKQIQKVDTEKKIDLSTIQKKYVDDNVLSKSIGIFLQAPNSLQEFSDEEIEKIQETLKDNRAEARLAYRSDDNYDEFTTTEYLDAPEQLKRYLNLDGLGDELKQKVIAAFGGPEGFKEYIATGLMGALGENGKRDGGVKKELEDATFKTILEQALKSEGDNKQSMLLLGEALKKGESALLENSLAATPKRINDVTNILEQVPITAINQISDIIKDIPNASIKHQNIPGQGAYYELKQDGKLNKEDKEKFDEAQILLHNVQNTTQILQDDRRQSIENFINTVVELKETYKEQGIEYKNLKEKQINDLTSKLNEDTGKNYTEEEATKIVTESHDKDINLVDALYKEYKTSDLLAKDFGDAAYSIVLALPTIFNADWATDEQARLNSKEQMYMDMLTVDNMSSNRGLFMLRTLFQQAPNILLAIGTGAALGTVRGLSEGMARTILAYGAFGLPAGAENYRNLSIQKGLVNSAYSQQEWLTEAYNEGKIDRYTFANGMGDAAQTIAMGDLSEAQMIASSVMTGMVEGTVTRFIGSATNTMKILKDIKGISPIGQQALANQTSSLGRYGLFGMEYLKRTGSELIEESTILFGNQLLSEYAILDRDFNMDQLDDTLMSTLITAGFSNGPSLAYSAVVNVSLSEKMRETASKQVNQIKYLKKALANGKLSDQQKATINADITERLVGLAELNGQAAVDAWALGPEKLKRLLHFKQIKDGLMFQAGVRAGDGKNANRVVGQYKRTLTKDQRLAFEAELNGINSSINEIRNNPNKDYKSVITALNDGEGKFGFYDTAVEALNIKPTDQWKKAKTPQEKIAAVIAYTNDKINEENKELVRNNPEVQAQWAQEVANSIQQGRPIPDKEKWLAVVGKLWNQRTVEVITSVTESTKLTDLVRNAKDIKYIELNETISGKVSTKEAIKEELLSLYEKGNIDVEKYRTLLKGIISGTNGLIFTDQKGQVTYLVNNVGDAKARLETGDYRKGLVVLHELSHIQDDKFFGNTEKKLSVRGAQYADNLHSSLINNTNLQLRSIGVEAMALVDKLYPKKIKDKKGKIIPFDQRDDTYKDEFTKEAASLLYLREGDLQLEKEEKGFGLIDKIADKVFGGSRYNINTPDKALNYAIGSNAAYRQGEISEFQKRGIARQKKQKSGTKLSKVSINKSTVDQINEKNKDVENFTPITAKQVETMVNKVANRTWSRFGEPIPKNIREKFIGSKGDVGGRKRWVTEAKQILNTIALGFDASKSTFGSYMANTGMQRANSWARKEFNIPGAEQGARVSVETSKEAQTKTAETIDLKERAAKEAKEVSQPLLNKIKSKNKPSLVSTVTNVLTKEVQRRLAPVGQVSTVKTQSTLIKNLTKGLKDARVDGKNIYAKVIDDIGGRNKTINEFETFLTDNYSSLLEPGGLTTTYLSKAFPEAVEKYVVGKGWVKYPGWKGKKKGTQKGDIGFWNAAEEGPYQGSTSGLQKIRRISNIKNTIPLAKFKGKYIDGINNKVKVAPTEALAKQILAEVGLDVFREEMAKENSPIKKLFQERQELLGATAVVNFEAQIDKEIERAGIKFSLATLKGKKLDFWMNNRFKFYNQIIKSEKVDANTITRLHKEIFKNGEYSIKEHEGIAKQFSRFLIPVSKTDQEVFKTDKEFEDYLETITFTQDVNEAIVSFTNATKSISQMTQNWDNVIEARQYIVEKVTPFLIKKFGQEKALTLLAAYAKSTFSQGQENYGAFKTNKLNETVEHGTDSNRTAVFGKADTDILNNLILGEGLYNEIDTDGNTVQVRKVNFPNVKSIAKGKITFKNNTERKIDINTSASVQVKHLKGLTQEQITKDKADAKLAREFTEAVIEALPPKGENNNLTALILATMNASSNSSLRLAAPVWGKSAVMRYKSLKRPKLATAKDVKEGNAKKVGDKMYTPKGSLKMEGNYRYEHAVPARVVLWYLYDSKINKNKKIDLDLLFDDYRVTIIPIEMDNVITKAGFGSVMLASYVPGDQTWWKRYYNRFTKGKIPYALESYETGDKIGEDFQDYYNANMPPVFKPDSQQKVLQDSNADKAMRGARDSVKQSKNRKGISVFDFDDTLAKSKSKVLYTMPDGTKGKLSATEFAKDAAKMEKQGVVWDFSEFSKVIKGKKGPLADLALKRQGKFGSENLFVLTARPQEAAIPIQQFLASIGLDIPIDNITGLEDGTPKAKADWMVNKFAEGYNDFYFTDDALKNVKAVKEVLDVLDVKSKVQQARVKFSKDLSQEFNLMIERNKGIRAETRYSDVVAQRLGRNKKRWNFFIPPSADDFRGLTMYMFSGKGKKGEADMDFFNKSLILPYTRGIAALETARQTVSNDYRGLVKGFPKIKKLLRKKIKGTEFTHDEAVRVYLWNKAGYTIPGISKRDQAQLSKLVREDPNLSAFADGVLGITKKDQYIEPSKDWSGGTIISDLNYLTKSVNRIDYLEEFNRNVDVIFSKENLNKIEAVYGTRVKEALIDTIQRMKTGSNRTGGKDRIVNKWNDWVNNSVGAIMFLNRRSALLQLISSVNFINWGDNNPAMAALAFSNQPQFWKDVVYLFNSDKLKQRRAGLKGDINEAEIAAAVKGARNKTQAFISVLLKYGFTFTQIADSVAIATGGATMYRNRTNTYLKQGFTKAEAEAKAFIDFSLISDESQQSADPMLISKQQAGVMGRLILAFQNTPMQYTRLMKKAGLDIINGRGDLKTNISKIMYYGAIQNFIFSALQNALFALVPGFEDDDDELTEEEQMKAYGEVLNKKQDKILNGMLDTILRGSGLAGAAISTIKNAIRMYGIQDKKGFMADHTYTIIELANLSPPIGSKLRKIYSGIQTKDVFEKDPIAERGFDVTIDGKFNLSPAYQVVGDIASGAANVPLDRIVAEINAITEALDERNTIYQRVALALGFRTWDVNAKNEEEDLIKADAKLRRKEEGKRKAAETRKRKAAEKKAEFDALSEWEKNLIREEEFNKRMDAKMKALDKKMGIY